MTADYPIPVDREADAACAGLDVDFFFPPPVPGGPEKAKDVCRGCVFLHPCAAYAMSDPTVHGVWGALTYKDRARLRRLRRAS